MELKIYVGNQIFEKIEDYMTLEEFYTKSAEWIKADKSTWNHITLMSYFVCKYEMNYGVKYRMTRWKHNPAKSKESKDMSKLVKIFSEDIDSWGQSDNHKKMVIVKIYNYINWAFDRKFKYHNKINSTGLLLNHSIINEFEKIFNKKIKEHRGSMKLSTLKKWVSENLSDIKDEYEFNDENDVKIYCEFCKNNKFNSDDSEFILFQKIKQMGFV